MIFIAGMPTSFRTIVVATAVGVLASCTTPTSTPSSTEPVANSIPSLDTSADGASLSTTERDELPLPDGYQVAYTDATGVWLIEGMEAPRLLTPASAAGFPQIAPDGAHVAYWRLDQPSSIEGLPGSNLWVVDVDSGNAWEPIRTDDLPANDQGEASFLGLHAVRWLPDGSGMTFETLSSLEMTHGNENVWRLDLESGSLKRLVPDGRAGAYAFSPDGKWIALGTNGWPHGDRGQIAIVSADGDNWRVLYEHPYLPGTGSPAQLRDILRSAR